MSLEDQIIELSDTVELLTLDKEQLLIDKELLEEKCLQLQSQLDEALSNKKSTLPSSPVKHATINIQDSPEYKRLSEENEKYKEGLLRLAEAANRDKEQLKKQTTRVEELEKLVHDLQAYKQTAEVEMEELRQNVDSMSSFEAMIEKLTNDNSELSEKVQEYKETISELEDAAELNEELDHQQRKQIEEDLKTINNLNSTIASFERRIQEKEQIVQEYVRKLEQIKELYTTSKREVDRLNLLLSNEFQESKLIESKLQESVKLRVQCEDLSQELLLNRFQQFQTFQQKVRYQVLYTHMDSLFGGNSYYLEESKLLNAEVLALSTLTIGLETNRSVVEILNFMVNFSGNNNSSSTTSSFIFTHPALISILPHVSTIYSLSIQLQSGLSNSVLRLLKEQSLKRLSNDQVFQREVAQLTNLLMSARNSLGELMSLSIKVFGTLRQFADHHQQSLSSSGTSVPTGDVADVDITAFNSSFFEYGNSLNQISKSLAVLVRNAFLLPQSSLKPQEISDPLTISSLEDVNQVVLSSLKNGSNIILSSETVLLLMSNIVECTSLSIHLNASALEGSIDNENIPMEDVLRSAKFEIDQLMKNIRRVNVAVSASNSNAFVGLVDCYRRLSSYCNGNNSLLRYSVNDNDGSFVEEIKSNVLAPLRKISNSVVGDVHSPLDNSSIICMKYFPSSCMVSSVRGRDLKLLNEQYHQYQEKYWNLLLQGSNDLMPVNGSSLPTENQTGNDLAWKQRVSDLRLVITAKFNTLTDSIEEGEMSSEFLKKVKELPVSPLKTTAADALVSKQQHQQILHELDIKKDELRAAMNKCAELENIVQQSSKNVDNQLSSGQSDATVEKLSKEIKTLEAALSTIELKSDSLAKENKQLKQQIVSLGGTPESSTDATSTVYNASVKEVKPATRRRSQLDGTAVDNKSVKPGATGIEADFAALLNSVPSAKNKTSTSGGMSGKDTSLVATNQSLNEKVTVLSGHVAYWKKIAFKRVTQSLLPLDFEQNSSPGYDAKDISGTTDKVQVLVNNVHGNPKQDLHATYLQLRKERAKRIRIRQLPETGEEPGCKSATALAIANGAQSSGWRVSALQRRNTIVYKILTHGALTID